MADFDMSISGQFSRAGVDDVAPSPEFTKITEGFAAVLFPPAKHHNGKGEANEKNKKHSNLDDNTTANNAKTGDATGFFINNEFGGNEDDQAVFYNPAQVVNRDLTICVMETFSRQRRTEPIRKGGVGDRGITIVEALSASGLRSVRYWKEITGLKYIVANDLDPDAVECMKRNLAFNKIPIGHATFTGNTPAKEWRGVVPNEDDAVVLMQRLGSDPLAKLRAVGVKVAPPQYVAMGDRATLIGAEEEKKDDGEATAAAPSSPSALLDGVQPQFVPLLQADKMDVVDLDPYGSASPFLDSAMQCVKEGGLMCITSTDSAILCGTYPETAHAKYNSVTIRHNACHEMAVRTLLAAVERTANKHKKYIVPLLSLHIDFYVRIFIRVYTQQAEVKLAACKLAHYFKCTRCPNFSVLPLGRVRTHGKLGGDENGNNGHTAAENRGGQKTQKKERRADKREREEQEAQLKKATEGSTAADATATATAASEETTAATATPALPDGVVSAASRSLNSPAAFNDFTRQAPNAFPPNHDRSVPFSVNPTTIRNVSYECCVCHGAMAIAGPIYAAPMHNQAFLEALDKVIVERHGEERLTATNRIRGLVAAAKDELPNAPMFVEVPEIASLCKLPTPPLPEFVGAVCRLGYSASQVHCNHSGLKTDAPVDVLVGLMLDYQRRFCPKKAVTAAAGEEEAVAEKKEETDDANTTAAAATSSSTTAAVSEKKKQPFNPLADEFGGRRIFVPAIEGDFSYDKAYDFKRNNTTQGGNNVVKFVQNAPGWGPKARHRGVARDEE